MNKIHNTLRNSMLLLIFILNPVLSAGIDDGIFFSKVDKFVHNAKGVVSEVFQIQLKEYPTAWNPSILEIENGYILTFRYLPEPENKPWISYIGAVFLNYDFERLGAAELVDVRLENFDVPSQAEDARVYNYQNRIYLTYNDNRKITNTSERDRREIYVAELIYKDQHFTASNPVKLIHPHMYNRRAWEKNWMPFVWNDTLLMSYSMTPHEILHPNFETGECFPLFCSETLVNWKWGILRGSTPPLLVDGEYLAFFHSCKDMVTGATDNQNLWHYFMGAYTFSSNPPFNITKISALPINHPSFYLNSHHPKRVIYPGGYVVRGENIYVAYGRDDCEMWIAVINKKKLMSSLKNVK